MLKRGLLLIALFFTFVTLANAQTPQIHDWNQWRGQDGMGTAFGVILPKSLPEQLKRIWKVDVGIGHSTPVVSGDRVFVLSRQGDSEIVACYSLSTGELVWKDSYPAQYTMNPAAVTHGKGPKSTPIISKGKLYTLGINGVLSCYDPPTGKLLWRKDFAKRFKSTSPDFGTAASPIIDRNLLIVFVGGHNSGALIAFDVNTGAEKWSWTGDGPGYATPIVVEFLNVRQVITQSQQNIVSISAKTGQLVWQIPFTTEYDQNIITPMQYLDKLIFSGINKGTFAVSLKEVGGKIKPETVWENKDISMYMSSPILDGDYLYGMSHKRKGQFFCLNAKTGATLWTSEGREGDNAAFVMTASGIFILSDDAVLTLVKPNEAKYEILKKYTVAQSPTWAHPVLVGNHLLIKDQNSLALWSFE